MQKALELAARGAGMTAPNPAVGCVLVKDGRIIASGWHRKAGSDHAEVAALRQAGESARGCTAYVTLEPCNHTGRTGPCTEALIEAGVQEVVFALPDPCPVAGGGAARLRAAGVRVRSHVCHEEAAELNRAWIHALRYRRPHVTGKAAMTLDGRIATSGGESRWITSPESRKKAHRFRQSVNAVLVGAQTVLEDNPSLSARTADGVFRPLRVVLDSSGRTPPESKVYDPAGEGAMIVTTDRTPRDRLDAYTNAGVDTRIVSADARGKPCLQETLAILHAREKTALLVEGGGKVLGSFFDADLLDEIHLYIAPCIFGAGMPAFNGCGVRQIAHGRRYTFDTPVMTGGDMFVRGKRERSAC